jgi:hypothetical protein
MSPATLKDERNNVTISADGQSVTVRPYSASSGIFDSLRFNTSAGATADDEGEVVWNNTDKTLDLKVNGATLQMGQEFHVRVHNNSGAQLGNGKVIAVSGVSNNRPSAALADASVRQSARSVLGLATEDIADGSEGFVTAKGLVRGVNTSSWIVGTPLFLDGSTAGDLKPYASPAPPLAVVFIGIVVAQHATAGAIYVDLVNQPLLTELVDVDVNSPATGEILVYNASTQTFENKVPNSTIHFSLPFYESKPDRGSELQMLGGMESVISGGSVSSGSPDVGTSGCSKLLFVINAGSDTAGSITITGDSVDRNTGAVTASDTEVVTIDGLTTDASDTDAVGNPRYSITSAPITTKWFQGSVTISTTDVNLSDFDCYGVAFHQFGDDPASVVVAGIDITALSTSTDGWLYAYMYSLEVTDGMATITRIASAELPSSVVTAARHHRRKIDNAAKALNPSTDGIWINIYPGPFNQRYWQDMTVLALYDATSPVVLS